jgi:hypothetical protein
MTSVLFFNVSNPLRHDQFFYIAFVFKIATKTLDMSDLILNISIQIPFMYESKYNHRYVQIHVKEIIEVY